MELSSYYQVQYTYDDGSQVAYNWNDDTHADTYQSFASTQKGTIDQSIYGFTRQNNAWAYGANYTFRMTGDSPGLPYMEVQSNRLKKNNAMFFRDWNTQANTGEFYQNYCYYSPGVATCLGVNPWINMYYNKMYVRPLVTLVHPTSGAYVISKTINEWLSEYPEYKCSLLSIDVVKLLTNNAGLYYPLICQYAGIIYKNIFSGNKFYRGDGLEGVYYCFNAGSYQILYSSFSSNANNLSSSRILNALFLDITQMDTSVCYSNMDRQYHHCISYSDVYYILNNLGVYWTSAFTVEGELGQNCSDPNVHCPVIDSDTRMVTDTVLVGEEIAQYAYDHRDDEYCNFNLDYGAGTDEQGNPVGITYQQYIESPNWNPNQPTVDEADIIDLNQPVIATTGGNTCWIMTEGYVKTFFTFLWNPDGTIFSDIVQAVQLLGENPMDSIVSLRFYPLDLTNYTSTSTHNIFFGRYDTLLPNRYLTSTNIINLDLGTFYFNDVGMFKDFRDYEPYSRYMLYIPFCGIVELTAIECIGTTIQIKMIIDLVTGACTAVIFTNNVPYRYIDGMIGIEVPVTGRNMAQYGQQILNAALAGATGGVIAGSKAAVARPTFSNQLNAASGNLHEDLSGASYDMSNPNGVFNDFRNANAPAFMRTPGYAVAGGALGLAFGAAGAAVGGMGAALLNAPKPQMSGSNAPAMGMSKPLYPYIIVQRSDSWLPENYTELYGRPLQEGGVVGDFTGYSEFGNVRLDNISNATAEEKTLISKLLVNGVYL